MTATTEIPLHNREKEMIPRVLLRGMLALALSALAITSYAVLTDRAPTGQPKPGNVVEQREFILIGGGAKAVKVAAPDGTILLDLPHGGFVTVIQNGLAFERKRQGVAQDLPVRLVKYDNNRLTIHDPATGWSAELHAFGSDNKAAFERLLSD